MEEYKCPICGSTKNVNIAILSTNTAVSIAKPGDTRDPAFWDRCDLAPRGLINWSTESFGDGRTDITFAPQVSTKICTGCGFVSFHALDLAKAVAQDLVMLQEKDAALLAKKEKLLEEKASLDEELESLPEKQNQLNRLLQSEDITIRQQKEYQAQLAELAERKDEINSRIREIDNRIKEIEYNRDLIYKANERVHDHSIDSILTHMK